jgi:hypothetical protein
VKMSVNPSDLIKLTIADWIGRVAHDPSITLEDFRFAQRLCSKVRNEEFGITVRKLMKKSDAASLAALVQRGYLLDLKIESEHQLCTSAHDVSPRDWGLSMNRRVTPQQLDMVKELSREEMILASATHIDPDSEALKESFERLKPIAVAEAATAVLAASAPAKDESYDDFDWSSDPSIVLREQRATAVYRNDYNSIVIRQERTWDEDSDPFMVIADDNSTAFMEALAKVARS